VNKAETESTSSSIKLSYTPPGESDREPQEMVREADRPIRVGRDPGHMGLQLSAKEDRSVSKYAVEITLVGEGVLLKANNRAPMRYGTTKGESGELGDSHPLAGFSEDGWIEIPGDDGQVAHRVHWELRDFAPLPKERTDSGIGVPIGKVVFRDLDVMSHLLTCAALVAPRFFTLDEIHENGVPSNPQIAHMKGKPTTTGGKDVEHLKDRIHLLYQRMEKPAPGFLGREGRVALVDWVMSNGDLTAEQIRELLPGLERLNPR
jgi:hypothetical protein